eukprot:10527168-Alexandrium_andersonii.AAC.1
MDAMARPPGSTAAHSAAAYASQCVSGSRHGRPRSNRAAGVVRHQPPQVPGSDGATVRAVGVPALA